MPTIVKLKNSVTTTAAPSSLVQGEVAVNVTDKKVWVGNAATTPVQILGAGATVSGTDLAYTGTLTGGTGVVNLGSGQFYKDASGNVGIGTSAPAQKLDIAGSGLTVARIRGGTSAGQGAGYFVANAALTSTLIALADDSTINGGTPEVNMSIYSTKPLLFYSNSLERMRIDSAGNVGIGTSSPSAKLDIDGGFLQTKTAGTVTGRFGSSTYITTGTGTDLVIQTVQAASNTVFVGGSTERMRIDSNGNLGIGTSSPSSKLHLSVSSGVVQQQFNNGGTSSYIGIDPAFSGLDIAAGGGIRLRYFTGSVFAEGMRIDSSGNVGIGTSSPNALLNIQKADVSGFSANSSFDCLVVENGTSGLGTVVQIVAATDGSSEVAFSDSTRNVGLIAYNHTSNFMEFRTNSTERMRIDSSGNLLIGQTVAAGGNNGIFLRNNPAGAGSSVMVSHANGTGNANSFMEFFYSTSQIGSIVQVSTSAVIYNTTSDYRLKTVIAPVSDSGTRIDALQPIEYDWKAGGRTRGFLAHQFAEVYPSSVSGEKDAVDAEGKPVYQGMQASTPEVMADLIAEIQSLRKRVAQLEGN